MRRGLAVVVCALAFSCPAVATAGDWRPQHKLTDAGAEPQVAILGGEGTVVWGPHSPTAGEAGGAGVEAVLGPLGEPFAPPVRLSPGAAVAPRLFVGPAGHELVTWWREDFQLGYSVRPPGGVFGPEHTIAHAARGGPQVAVDASGRVYCALDLTDLSSSGGRLTDLAVETIAPDGTVESVRDVARQDDIMGVSLQVDAAGDATVAWRGVRAGETGDRSHAFVATAPPAGEFATQVLSGPYYDDNASNAETQTVGDARGDVLVVWPQLPHGPPPGATAPQPFNGFASFHAAFKPAGGSFGPEEVLAPPQGIAMNFGSYRVAMGPHGEALLAANDSMHVWMAYRPAGGRLEGWRAAGQYPEWGGDDGRRQQGPPAVAFDPAGDAAVVYSVTGERGKSIEAIWRPAGADFQPPQRVTDVKPINDPVVAVGANGDAIAAWSPQARNSWSPSDRDTGIYVAVYDADAPPRVERAALRRSARAIALLASDGGRARIVVARGRRNLLARQRRVAPGENVVRLTTRQRRLLRRRGRYTATITIRDHAGRVSKPRRIRFRAL